MKTDDFLICRCEEVTKQDVLQAIADGLHTVSAIKRATRAGMGACQGRTCGRLIQQILVAEGIAAPAELAPDKARFPSVPCDIDSFGGEDNG